MSAWRLALAVFALAAGLHLDALAADLQTIELWPEGVPGLRADAGPERIENDRVYGVHTPTLTLHVAAPERRNGTAVIVCPGGGYMRLAIGHEGRDVAAWLNEHGVTAFVLRYRMVEYGHPAPLCDVLRAVRMVRSRAAEFGVNPERIGVIGASAGGHLAASAGTLFDAPEGRTGAPLDAVSGRPDFMILMYPVITMQDPHAHAGSRRALLGENPPPALAEKMSLENQVTAQTPPAFIVHTQEDASVPIENALLFYQALRRAGVPVEMHLYERGPHGFGLRSGHGQTSLWPERAIEWMRGHGWLPEG